MDRYFTKTFRKFFTGFVIILCLALGVMLAGSSWNRIHPLDNVKVSD